MTDAAICVKGGGGLLLPLGGDAEQEWPRGLRVVLYMLGLFWCFIGVAIIADVFMSAIEKVTSKKTKRWDKQLQRYYTFEVWNPTVANLTLMALGSSAPEILLNVIDILANSFFLEGLGPSTIVGSAAFNLLLILAVCIVAIPDGQVRKIEEMPVYVCTAVWSIFAYVWLLVILMLISPNVVEIWEGVLTFLFFPLLCVMAFCADKGYCGGEAAGAGLSVNDMTDEELAEAQDMVRRQHGEDLTPDQIGRILTHMEYMKKSKRAIYRIGSVRSMFGGKRLELPQSAQPVTKQMSFLQATKVVPVLAEAEQQKCFFEFAVGKYAVLENVDTFKLPVHRKGDTESAARIRYKTIDGTGKAGKDYEHAEGVLMFEAGQVVANVVLTIIDDEVCEDDEEFHVELSKPEVLEDQKGAELGALTRATIVIIDDDDAGIISFPESAITVCQKVEGYFAEMRVQRSFGSNGEVKLQYRTEEDSAKDGRDFTMCSGEVVFDDQQVEALIRIKILTIARYETTDIFRVFLSEPTGGAKLNPRTDGGSGREILTVTIAAEEGTKERVQQIKNSVKVSWDKAKVGHRHWADQFREASRVNGGDEEAKPTCMDWTMHIIALPWKLLFAIVPPTDYAGGWICFVVALFMIGGVTVIIGDMAGLLGCCMCIPADITAITFVALGTSLPDTFASKTAAVQDPMADAAVGNVTGSNSVNVFLGLGLPWMMAGIAWAMAGNNSKWQSRYQMAEGLDWLGPAGSRDQAFVVQAGTLGFSVAVFSCCAAVCLGTLQLRRVLFGGELGGPTRSKWLSAGFLVFTWILYVVLSAWKSLQENSGGCAV